MQAYISTASGNMLMVFRRNYDDTTQYVTQQKGKTDGLALFVCHSDAE